VPLVGICAGGAGHPASLPRPLLGNPIPNIQIDEEN
jgi:hypothetical protein